MGRTKTRKMSAIQFDAVQLLITHMSPERRAAARLALVEGQTQQSIAAIYGWGRTAVDNAERTIWKAPARYEAAKKLEEKASSALPRGWGRVTVDVPRALAKKLMLMPQPRYPIALARLRSRHSRPQGFSCQSASHSSARR